MKNYAIPVKFFDKSDLLYLFNDIKDDLIVLEPWMLELFDFEKDDNYITRRTSTIQPSTLVYLMVYKTKKKCYKEINEKLKSWGNDNGTTF